jgi:hypothetical protein
MFQTQICTHAFVCFARRLENNLLNKNCQDHCIPLLRKKLASRTHVRFLVLGFSTRSPRRQFKNDNKQTPRQTTAFSADLTIKIKKIRLRFLVYRVQRTMCGRSWTTTIDNEGINFRTHHRRYGRRRLPSRERIKATDTNVWTNSLANAKKKKNQQCKDVCVAFKATDIDVWTNSGKMASVETVHTSINKLIL